MQRFDITYRNDPKELRRQIRRLGLRSRLQLEKFHNVGLRQLGTYNIRIVIAEGFRDTAPSARLEKMHKNKRRGLTLLEALALVEHSPDVLRAFSLDIIHSRYGKECIPTLYEWGGIRYLSAICPDTHEMSCIAPEVVKCELVGE